MKTKQQYQRINRGTMRVKHRHLPLVAHVIELLAAIVIFAGGQSLWAVLAGASPDITPPSTPINLQLTGRSTTEIEIGWDASTDDVGVDHYEIYRDGTALLSTTSTSYADQSLPANTNYTYNVTALDAAGNESPQSTTLSTGTLADTAPPSTPSNVHQTGSTTSTISFAWDASSDNVGVAVYQIYRDGSLIRAQSGTSFTDTGLPVYTGYSYNIVARDAAGNGSQLSVTLHASTAQDVTPPSVPDGVHETSSSVSSISLVWNNSTDDVGVTGYHIYRDGSVIASTGGTTYTDSGRNVSSNYTYTISAYDGSGNESAQSATFSGRSSDDTTPPTIPSNLHTTDVKDTSLTIAWDASTDDVGVMGYKIYRNNTLVGTTTTATSFTDTSLTPVTQYGYTIVAYDAANNVSASSASLPATTAYDTTAPSVPGNLRTAAATDTTISLVWDASTDNVGVTGYDVYRGSTLITTTSATNFTDAGLSVSTAYTYRVRAHDASANNSAQTSPLTTSTIADMVAPTVPANLASGNQTTTSIDLNWNAATDDVAVAGYNLYRGGQFIAHVSGLNYSDTSLTYNTAYSYTVTALDGADNESPQSTALVASTLPDTTDPVVAITAPGDEQTVRLTFPISATASDDLALNRVEFYVDGSLIQTITSAPFSFNWNSYAVHNGSHSLSAKAIDASGNYSSQTITINVTNPPPALQGDLNGDHKVNIYDLSVLLSHWGKSGAGDFNNNGKVDIFDLSVLLSQYGKDNSNYQ